MVPSQQSDIPCSITPTQKLAQQTVTPLVISPESGQVLETLPDQALVETRPGPPFQVLSDMEFDAHLINPGALPPNPNLAPFVIMPE